MAPSCFDDRSHKPDKRQIKTALGSSSDLWFGLIEDVSAQFAPIVEEWAFSGANYGWSLRLIHKKRRILYLIPQKGHFLAAVVFGDKAVVAANESSLPAEVLRELNDAPKYAEGRGIRLQVKSREDLKTVETLVSIKVGH